MGKKDKDRGGKKHRKHAKAESMAAKDLSTSVPPFMIEMSVEAETVKRLVKQLHRIPTAVNDTVDTGYNAEDIALTLCRVYLRMGMLLTAWGQSGFPEADAGHLRMVRADTRVLFELIVPMLNQLLELGRAEGTAQ